MLSSRFKLAFLALAAALLSGCASLTADRPLFPPEEVVGYTWFEEGVWMRVGEECPERLARRAVVPGKCYPGELRSNADGSWTFRYQEQVPHAEEGPDPPRAWRIVFAPATVRQPEEGNVPLYIAEMIPLGVDATPESTGIGYALIVPLPGHLPTQRLAVITRLDCSDILRDGPIEGVIELRNPEGGLSGCVAASQSAVREAARRQIVEDMPYLVGEQSTAMTLMFVRP